MYTDQEIRQVMINRLNAGDVHENYDRVRIACEWLSAQTRTKKVSKTFGLKHLIESWAKNYVSSSDVSVAAEMLGLNGSYPEYDISKKFTFPSPERLFKYCDSFTHVLYRLDASDYRSTESGMPILTEIELIDSMTEQKIQHHQLKQ